MYFSLALLSKANLKSKKEIFSQFKNVIANLKKNNFAHQFLAELIPTINNTENPTQSMNLIGENNFITDQYIILQVLTPRLKMDCCSEAARYLEVWGTEFL